MIKFFGNQSKVVFAVKSSVIPNNQTLSKLSWLFDSSLINKKKISRKFIGPKATMITPWSTNAVEIVQNMGIKNISRIEKYLLADNFIDFDPMLQEKFFSLGQNLFELQNTPEHILQIKNISRFNQKEGLALNFSEIKYLENLALKLNRSLTDSEVFGFSQVNSEHCRHKIFNGKFIINGKQKKDSLFDLIKKNFKKESQRYYICI